MDNRKVFIYALVESGSAEVRYVGQTVNPESRLVGHLDSSRMSESNPKRIWIEDVLSRGGTLSINVIEESTPGEAKNREQYWIDYYSKSGAVLTNTFGAMPSPVTWRSAGGRVNCNTPLPSRHAVSFGPHVSVYLSSKKKVNVFDLVRKHCEKATDIETGGTKRQSLARIEERIIELHNQQEWQRALLLKIAEKVGIEV